MAAQVERIEMPFPLRTVTPTASSDRRPRGVIAQVVPEGQGGVRDYMEGLEGQWRRLGVTSSSLALSREAARVRPLHARLEDAARLAPGGELLLLLHFSGYGYAPRGLCFWLLEEIAAARVVHGQRLHLAVVFHELSASGPPWRSAFWVSPLQAWIATRLARMADLLWTNTAFHAGWLSDAAPGRSAVYVRPVFSNVGEPELTTAVAARVPRAVVFGSASTRRRVMEALRGREAALRRLGISELAEVGSGEPAGTSSLTCRHLGALQAQAVAQLLQESRFALIDYPSIHLAKSGVFAAYAAHGCVALNTAPAGPVADGLRAGEHYLTLGDQLVEGDALQVSRAARRWYAGHALAQQASEMLAAMAAVQ